MDVTGWTCLLLGKVGLHAERCVRRLSPRATCRRCIEACPLEAIKVAGEGLKIGECNRCGLCTVVCPTEALQDPEKIPDFYLARGREVLQAYEQVVFTCGPARKEFRGRDHLLTVTCLGAVPLEVMVALATEGKVIFFRQGQACTSCPLAPGGKIFEEHLELAHGMIAALGLPENRITLENKIPPAAPLESRRDREGQAAMGRREFFAALVRGLKLKSSSEGSNRPALPSSRRDILQEVWTRLDSAEKEVPWPQPGRKLAGPCSTMREPSSFEAWPSLPRDLSGTIYRKWRAHCTINGDTRAPGGRPGALVP
ncbi:4Fe-4S binding protein [Moorellaceae bacterium AZ2]